MSTSSLQKNEPDMQAVCSRIKRLAAERGMGPRELAKEADLSERQIYKILNGAAKLRAATVGKLARALNCTIDFLLTGAGPPVSRVMESPVQYLPKGMIKTVDELIGDIAKQLGLDRDDLGASIAKLLSMKHTKRGE